MYLYCTREEPLCILLDYFRRPRLLLLSRAVSRIICWQACIVFLEFLTKCSHVHILFSLPRNPIDADFETLIMFAA